MSDFSSNAYAREQRLQKATRIRELLTQSQLWADHELWPTGSEQHVDQERTRREVERRAGVRRCSDVTWYVVLELLEQHRRDVADQAARDEELQW